MLLAVRRKIREENGHIVMALPTIVLFFAVLVSIVLISQTVTSADVILANSVKMATEGAALQYDVIDKEKIIIPERAYNVFTDLLAKNLELNNNLEPKKYSAFSGKPKFKLIVYNGNDGNRNAGGMIYEYDNRLTESAIFDGEFPATFYINSKKIILNSPGVISAVEIPAKKMFGDTVLYKKIWFCKLPKK
ncbi:hypothetical protein JOC37_001314 [Desulfohalotomaculum tongense]|uniref:hypothetical protein n=1 Tax=Desulforadius tongensis TaxID=1216062 RepID=UPI0019579094|nr:hypothetical protein [Desulforadius tongensis]MBM7854934.1 hypothetical protein [Desulforadius tongensis]